MIFFRENGTFDEEKTNAVLGKRFITLWGRDYIIDTLGGVALKITAPSFYQVNHDGAEVLYNKAIEFAELSGDALKDAIKAKIQEKDGDLVGNMISEGTTPRRLTDLIGSLCDLTSGSGDKGTPIVYIQGYFDNYTTE